MNPIISWSPYGVKLLTFTSTFPVWQFPAKAYLYPGQETFQDRITVSADLYPVITQQAEQQMQSGGTASLPTLK